MATEQILKKEDGLILDKNRYFKKQGKGGLTLTPSKLSFISQYNNELFSIPLSNILNVRAEPFMKGCDSLIILFSEDDSERTATVKHHPGWVAIGGFGAMERVREPHFKSWEKLIDETRLGKNGSSSTSFDVLEKLADLKEKGVITEEEFSAKKKQLLGI